MAANEHHPSVFAPPNERERAMQERTLNNTANSKQVAGSHYRSGIQHWDFVIANDLDYFQGQITKYVMRWKKKNGVQDLEKAQHFLEKYLEAVRAGVTFTNAAVEIPSVKPTNSEEFKTFTTREMPHYEVPYHFETEGFVQEGDWWRCKHCRERFLTQQGVNPASIHWCSAGDPTGGGYVDQAKD